MEPIGISQAPLSYLPPPPELLPVPPSAPLSPSDSGTDAVNVAATAQLIPKLLIARRMPKWTSEYCCTHWSKKDCATKPFSDRTGRDLKIQLGRFENTAGQCEARARDATQVEVASKQVPAELMSGVAKARAVRATRQRKSKPDLRKPSANSNNSCRKP